MNEMKLISLIESVLNDDTDTRSDSILVNELPLLDTYEKVEHDIVGVGGDLYRVNATENHGYRLGAYHSEPTTMLSENITSSDNVTLTIEDGKFHIDVSATGIPELDLTEINERIDTNAEDIVAIGNTVSAVTTRLDNVANRVTQLENDKTPSKWYILPLGGQSNMTGFSELPYILTEPNPRLMQLGILGTSKTSGNDYTVIDPTTFGFTEDLMDKYRPYGDCNLKLIPSAPCLDVVKNIHHHFYHNSRAPNNPKRRVRGGGAGVGHYIAKAILPYIPEDYGILIVNASIRSGGFGDENPLGTYDEETLKASYSSFRIGKDDPYGRMLRDRIKYALDLNTENKLLPIIWMQGESDSDPVVHLNGMKELFKAVKQDLLDGGYSNRLPFENINNFRWICSSSTKILLGVDGSMEYLTNDIDYVNDKTYLLANYDNYAYLMDDPELRDPGNNNPQLVYARMDLDTNARYYETVLEELISCGIGKADSVGSYQPDWHWSTAVVAAQQAGFILNILSNYTYNLISGPMPSKWSRKIRGNQESVITDGVVFEYDNSMDFNFDKENGLVVHRDFEAGTDFSVSTVTDKSETIVEAEDSVYGTVARFTGSEAGVSLDANLNNEDYSVSILLKLDAENRNTDFCIFGDDSTHKTPRLSLINGSLVYYVACGTNNGTNTSHYNVSLSKGLFGAWNKGFGDWQYITTCFKKDLGITNVYLNGCLIETIKNNPFTVMNTLSIGSLEGTSLFAHADISCYRIYSRCLSTKEVNTLHYLDTELRKI